MSQLVYPTLAAASGALGISRGILSKAKRSGASGFRANGTVHIGELASWALTAKLNGEDLLDPTQEKARLARAQSLKIERENALADGKIEDSAKVEEIIWQKWLQPVTDAWRAYPHTTGLKLRAMLENAGVNKELVNQVCETAFDGVREPLRLANKEQDKA